MEPVTESFKITRIWLENIRAFRELDLDIRDAAGSARSKTLIIGKNGTCKSSLLRAVALGLADQTDASSLISVPIGGLVTEGVPNGSVKLWVVDSRGRRLDQVLGKQFVRFGDKDEPKPIDDSPHFDRPFLGRPIPFVCAYGAGRHGVGLESESGRQYRLADSVYTLFDYQQPLVGSELTLRRLNDFLETDVYERTLSGIKRALDLSPNDEIKLPRGGGVEVSGPSVGSAGNPIRLEAWADGYRMTFSWILDLYAWAMRAGSIDEDGHVQGILLIDEIEQHLHPSMQAEILPRLSELLPKMQIFATTHSPLVALDAKPEELVVLRREGDRVVAEQSVPDFTGYSAEDMLSDPRLFDSEVYGQETREKLHEYRDLVSIPKEERDPRQRQRLRSLAAEVSSFNPPAGRENEATRVLKELIAKHNL